MHHCHISYWRYEPQITERDCLSNRYVRRGALQGYQDGSRNRNIGDFRNCMDVGTVSCFERVREQTLLFAVYSERDVAEEVHRCVVRMFAVERLVSAVCVARSYLRTYEVTGVTYRMRAQNLLTTVRTHFDEQLDGCIQKNGARIDWVDNALNERSVRQHHVGEMQGLHVGVGRGYSASAGYCFASLVCCAE